MPPCAHTECDRFTGTSEIRSTGTLASHSLITVISPASPPPTTTTLRTFPPSLFVMLFAAIVLSRNPCQGPPAAAAIGSGGGREDVRAGPGAGRRRAEERRAAREVEDRVGAEHEDHDAEHAEGGRRSHLRAARDRDPP